MLHDGCRGIGPVVLCAPALLQRPLPFATTPRVIAIEMYPKRVSHSLLVQELVEIRAHFDSAIAKDEKSCTVGAGPQLD